MNCNRKDRIHEGTGFMYDQTYFFSNLINYYNELITRTGSLALLASQEVVLVAVTASAIENILKNIEKRNTGQR